MSREGERESGEGERRVSGEVEGRERVRKVRGERERVGMVWRVKVSGKGEGREGDGQKGRMSGEGEERE